MNTEKTNRVKLENIQDPAETSSAIERVILVVGATPEYAKSVAESFAHQGDKIRVVWFELARQALSSDLLKALSGVIVCHHPEHPPETELNELRRALPDTPVLPWQIA